MDEVPHIQSQGFALRNSVRLILSGLAGIALSLGLGYALDLVGLNVGKAIGKVLAFAGLAVAGGVIWLLVEWIGDLWDWFWRKGPWKPFFNANTKAALSELNKAMQAEHGMAFSWIGPQIKQLLRHKNGHLVALMRQRGVDHDIIVLAAAKFVLDRELPSGRYHIYRGVLSEQGEFLLDLHTYATRKLFAAEPQAVSAQEEINSMKDAISKVG